MWPEPLTPSPQVLLQDLSCVQSELNDWIAHPPEGCMLDTFDPLLNWTIQMLGPETAPAPGLPRLYENEVYRLSVKFTDRYPMEPPGTGTRHSPLRVLYCAACSVGPHPDAGQ